jgi:hypothetical protein
MKDNSRHRTSHKVDHEADFLPRTLLQFLVLAAENCRHLAGTCTATGTLYYLKVKFVPTA